MDKVNFTPLQKFVFDRFSQSKNLRNQFYFTGGTALSVFYFNHRESDDLDFFCEKDFSDELVVNFINKIALELKTTAKQTKIENTRIFEFEKDKQHIIKVDFSHYPYPLLEKGIAYQNVSINSLRDIGANKLQTIIQRTEVKDFVDLYFLLREFTIWDLMYAVETKFKLEIDFLLLGIIFSKVEKFDYLPKMLKPLTLPDLKKFFLEKAKEVASRAVTK